MMIWSVYCSLLMIGPFIALFERHKCLSERHTSENVLREVLCIAAEDSKEEEETCA